MSAGRRGVDHWGPVVGQVVALAALALTVATATLMWFGHRRGVVAPQGYLGDLVVGSTFPLAGALVLQRQPRNAAGWIMLSAALVSVSALSHQWIHHSATEGAGALPLVGVFAWLASWTYFPYWLLPTLLPLLFPDGTLPSRRWRPVVVVIVGFVVVGAVGGLLNPVGDFDELGVRNPLGLGDGAVPYLRSMMTVGSSGAMLFGGLAGLTGLVLRQRRCRGRQRVQLQWLLLGFIATAVLIVGPGFLPNERLRDWAFALAFACIPAAVAVAVVRHGLFDVEVVINRTVAYGLLSGVGIGTYVLLVGLLGGLLGGTPIGPFLAAGLALGAALLRERAQRLVARRLFGRRADPYELVEQVGAELEASSVHEALTRLVTTVRSGLAVPFVVVESTLPEVGTVAVGAAPDGTGADAEEVPLVASGRRLGTLRAGRRRRGERLRPDELVALTAIARQAGALLHSAALVTELQRSQEQIVVAQEEERRRLRRDLHDGLGPALAGMALQIESLGTHLSDQPELADRAARLRERMAGTVAEVRRIVDGLRPGILDEAGLAGALAELGQLASQDCDVDVDASGVGADLPAAVEMAAYRIASEAVANALRHSHAERVVVTARAVQGVLELEVRDAGRGFGATAAGIGLESMHQRAREVGGDLDVESTPGRGTRVVARLPIGAR